MTPNLGLLEQIAAHSQRHLVFNALARAVDSLLHLAVVDRGLNTPPGMPAVGQRWIVGSAPTGEWTGHADEIAAWDGGKWVFFAPKEGFLAWVADEDAVYAWTGAQWAGLTAGRERLLANRTYYIRTDGNDANNGLADNAAGAFLTVQKFLDTVANNIDLNGFNAIGQVRDGVYSGKVLADAPFLGKGNVIVQGNAGTPGNVVITSADAEATIQAMRGATLFVQDFEVRGTGGSTAGIDARNGGQIRYSNLRFGACNNSHVSAFDNGYIECGGSYAIVAAAPQHYFAARNSTIRIFNNAVVTLTGTPAFANAFARSDRSGVVNFGPATFSGSATGKRFDVATNAVVVSGGVTFPGDVAGTTATGGQFV
jgi:hypothetical protein